MNIASFSKKGQNKPNQDAILSLKVNGYTLIAVADGMGGKHGGEIASKEAMKSIEETFSSNPNITISELFEKVHQSLITKSNTDSELSEMGTTLSLCIINEDKATIGHVGDTRIYHLRGQGIVTRTKDQTELQHLLEEGVISKRKAKSYKRKNILLSVLTPAKSYELYTVDFDLEPNDRLVLCSDGFYSIVSKLEIKDSSVASETSEQLNANLLTLVESKQIYDDYSCIVYQQ